MVQRPFAAEPLSCGVRMKKRIPFLALLCLLLTACMGQPAKPAAEQKPADRWEAIAQRGELTVGVCPDYPPYTFIDTGKQGYEQYIGYDMALARSLAKGWNLKLVVRHYGFDDLLRRVKAGEVDIALGGLAAREDRAKDMDFSMPYARGGFDLVLSASVKEINPEAFVGKVAVLANGDAEAMLPLLLPKAAITAYADHEQMRKALQAGEVQAAAVVAELAIDWLAEDQSLKLSQQVFSQSPVCLAVPKGEIQLLQRINEALSAITDAEKGQWMGEAIERQDALRQQ